VQRSLISKLIQSREYQNKSKSALENLYQKGFYTLPSPEDPSLLSQFSSLQLRIHPNVKLIKRNSTQREACQDVCVLKALSDEEATAGSRKVRLSRRVPALHFNIASRVSIALNR
jgi:hypothetical protein